MKVIEKISEMQRISSEYRKISKTIAVVPTMGSLHDGHVSLMNLAKQKADILVTSLFVNPTQFGPNEDFEKYPRDFDKDKNIAEINGTDYFFNPSVQEMYPDGFNSKVHVGLVSNKFEGEKRPGHFDGVATIVAKLFNATLPDIAVFGQKDYQQTAVIKKMIIDLNIPVDLVIAPTKREPDGLAMSSRNVYLSYEHRKQATILFQALEEGRVSIEAGLRNRKNINKILFEKLYSMPDIRVDYAAAVDASNFEEPELFIEGTNIALLLACYLGKTRLIDNLLIQI